MVKGTNNVVNPSPQSGSSGSSNTTVPAVLNTTAAPQSVSNIPQMQPDSFTPAEREERKLNAFRRITFTYAKRISHIFDTISPNGNNAETFFRNARAALEAVNDKDLIVNDINNSTTYLDDLIEMSMSLPFPVQMLYGLMFNRLKELIGHGSFDSEATKLIPGISPRSRENYMAATAILDINGMEKYYTCGLTIIYKFVKLIKDKKNLLMLPPNPKLDPIMYAFKEISKDESTVDKDYPRIMKYVVYWKDDFDGMDLDLDLYFKLYKTGYDISRREVALIKERAKSRKLFVNNYITQLIKLDLNTKKTISHYSKQHANQQSTKTATTTKDPISGFPTLIDLLTSLGRVSEYYMKKKRKLSPQEFGKLKEILPKLNNLQNI